VAIPGVCEITLTADRTSIARVKRIETRYPIRPPTLNLIHKSLARVKDVTGQVDRVADLYFWFVGDFVIIMLSFPDVATSIHDIID
jgi:hypothetical protein